MKCDNAIEPVAPTIKTAMSAIRNGMPREAPTIEQTRPEMLPGILLRKPE